MRVKILQVNKMCNPVNCIVVFPGVCSHTLLEDAAVRLPVVLLYSGIKQYRDERVQKEKCFLLRSCSGQWF